MAENLDQLTKTAADTCIFTHPAPRSIRMMRPGATAPLLTARSDTRLRDKLGIQIGLDRF